METHLRHFGAFFFCLILISCNIGSETDDSNAFQIIEDEYGSYASYLPDSVLNVLVLIPDFPWESEEEAIKQHIQHLTEYKDRWQTFADSNNMFLVIPSMGIGNFEAYIQLFGNTINADAYLNQLVDSLGNAHISAFDGKFYLYGHDEGADFASRFVLKHPQKVNRVVISTPNTLPLPDNDIEYPYGMKPTNQGKEESYVPNPLNWMEAAAEIPITIILGGEDTERQTPAPGQLGDSRLARAGNWLDKMNSFSLRNRQQPSKISIVRVENVGNDVALLTPKAQESILKQLEEEVPKEDIKKAPY